MTVRTHTTTTARLTRWTIPVLMSLAVVLLSACSGDAPPPAASAEPEATASPVVLATTTTDVSAPVSVPPGSVTLRDIPTAPEVLPTPERGADSVVEPGISVSVGLGQRVAIEGTGWAVRFDQVLEDSRCPVDAQCIWAGQATVRLVGEHEDGRVAALTMTLGPGDRGSGLLGDLVVEAQGIEPLRYAGTPPPQDYTINLRVSVAAVSPVAISGVRGHVTVGPMCPVMRESEPCPDQPYRAALIVRDSTGRVVARAESTEAGTYMVPLVPGRYEVEPRSLSGARLPHAGVQAFEVSASSWTDLDITFDSGIR